MVNPWNIVNNDAKQKGMKFEEPSFYSNAMGFYHAVDWKEPWIRAILCLHVILLVVVIVTRKYPTFQFGLIIAICTLIYFAETFNSYGAKNWQTFSTQDYFDKNGVFASVIFSSPLLILGVGIMLNALYETSQMLVTVKRLELGIDKRGKGDEKETEGGGSTVNKNGARRRKRSGSKKQKQKQ